MMPYGDCIVARRSRPQCIREHIMVVKCGAGSHGMCGAIKSFARMRARA